MLNLSLKILHIFLFSLLITLCFLLSPLVKCVDFEMGSFILLPQKPPLSKSKDPKDKKKFGNEFWDFCSLCKILRHFPLEQGINCISQRWSLSWSRRSSGWWEESAHQTLIQVRREHLSICDSVKENSHFWNNGVCSEHLPLGFKGYQGIFNGFGPWVGTIPWRRKWKPTPVFLPGKPHGQRSLEGYSPWGPKELDMT